ncbi:DoxX-like family protein [Micromonospora pattaloongensis]|uniref:DoxX-like family protein n=1 Tax=Micromonospora pattaloongensis TaxID=405436 RepID=A0A1H3P0R0_9ACTN|nr:DoxX family protein [Micromonospora pattaloongensis]SDY94620.1 DoxX-like family protein [Micromonospora pattaloongensis]
MNTVLWVLQILLAVAFGLAGLMKSTQPAAKLAPKMPYVEDFSAGTTRAIGVLELLAALGLILPAATGIAVILTPLAAAGLVIVMIGAVVVHARRAEWGNVPVNLVLLAAAAVVAWGRFGPYSF